MTVFHAIKPVATMAQNMSQAARITENGAELVKIHDRFGTGFQVGLGALIPFTPFIALGMAGDLID